MDSFAVGALLALLARSHVNKETITKTARFVLVTLSMLAAWLFVSNGARIEQTMFNSGVFECLGYTLIDLFFGAVLWLAACSTAVFKRARLLPVFGRYSYAIYIIHLPLHGVLYKLFAFKGITASWPPLVRLVPLLVFGPLSLLALAMVSWHAWEKHFIALKRYFEYAKKPELIADQAFAMPVTRVF